METFVFASALPPSVTVWSYTNTEVVDLALSSSCVSGWLSPPPSLPPPLPQCECESEFSSERGLRTCCSQPKLPNSTCLSYVWGPKWPLIIPPCLSDSLSPCKLSVILHSQGVTMETLCQGLLVKSVCAFHYQTTAQPKAFTIQQFNRPLFFFFSSLGHARPLLLLTF